MNRWFKKLQDRPEGDVVLGLGTLVCLDVSPAGRILATGGSVGVVFWNYEERRVIARCALKIAPIVALAFSPDGRRIAALGRYGSFGVFDVETGECIFSEELENPEGEPWSNDPSPRMQFDPAGTDLLVMADAHAWRLSNGVAEPLAGDEESAFEDGIVAGFSSTGEIVVLTESGMKFYRPNAKKKGFTCVRELPVAVGGDSVSVSPSGKYVFGEAQEGDKGSHAIVSLETGAILWRKHFRDNVYGARFAWRAPLVHVHAYKGEGLVAFPAHAGEKAQELKNKGKLEGGGVFPQWVLAPDGDFVVSGDSYGGDLVFRDLDGGEPFPELGRYIYDSDSAVTLFAVDEKADRCVLMGFIGDGQNSSGWAQGWSLKEDRPLEVLEDSVAFFCTSICGISGTDDVVIPVENGGVLVVGRASTTREPLAYDDGFQNAAARHDGTVVAAGSINGRLVMWDRKSRKVLVDVLAHENQVCGIGWQPGGDVVVTTSQDGMVKLWSANALLRGETTEPWAEVAVDDMLYQVAFSADGALCAVGTGSKGASVIDTKTGKRVAQLETKGGELMALAFHPLSGELVTGTLDGRLLVWDISRSTPILEVPLMDGEDETNGLTAVAFDARGAALLVSASSGVIWLWNLQ